MITGDYHHTAIAVARDVGMVKPEGQVVIIDTVVQPELQSEVTVLTGRCNTVTATLAATPCATFCQQHQASCHPSADPDQAAKQKQELQVAASLAVSETKQASRGQMPTYRQQQPQHLHQDAPHANGICVGPTSLPYEFANQLQTASDQKAHVRGAAPVAQPLAQPPFQVGSGASRSPSLNGLRFLIAQQDALDAAEALTALAEGQMQCAVTGDAFEYLLQHHDLSVLETVLRNVVVFSRMQPHQKGQVVNLLNMNGIHQLFDGQSRFIPVCSKRLPAFLDWKLLSAFTT